ncbi:hypothetical protein GOP47_0028624 [Adiantum capillus-veneris]|nr:hypothetical protein GOP47_0028624 [Adiantum capillus-veneris]
MHLPLVPAALLVVEHLALVALAGDTMDQFLSVAVDAARLAGKVIAENFNTVKQVEHKGQVDLVTETDKACEQLAFEHIEKVFPNHKFIGEETTALSGSFELTDAPTWIIDPLDGTTNFVHMFPFVCISIGLTIEKVPVVGVVYNPILDELFTAVKNGGAFLNGVPIRASLQEDIGSALLASEVGTKRDKLTVDATTKRINSLLFKVRSLRMTGSCALNLCGIACGRLDIFYELGYGGPWDVAAGVVIVQEAGGLIFSPSGEEFNISTQRIAASNSFLKDSFRERDNQALHADVLDLGGTVTERELPWALDLGAAYGGLVHVMHTGSPVCTWSYTV